MAAWIENGNGKSITRLQKGAAALYRAEQLLPTP
jgi:hypothetical protein